MNHAVPEQFLCFKCGACCLDITGVPKLEKWAVSSGACRYYDHDTRLCQIYQNRPEVCNVWKTYLKQYSDESVSWDDFVYTNMLNCCLLRYLNGIPEPDGSPFADNQEDTAAAVLANLVDPEAILKTVQNADSVPTQYRSADGTPLAGDGSKTASRRSPASQQRTYRPGDVDFSDIPSSSGFSGKSTSGKIPSDSGVGRRRSPR